MLNILCSFFFDMLSLVFISLPIKPKKPEDIHWKAFRAVSKKLGTYGAGSSWMNTPFLCGKTPHELIDEGRSSDVFDAIEDMA